MTDAAPTTGEPILIVDDEKNIRRTLRMVLEGEGHVVHEAGSIAEAIVILERAPIDLILLDVKLGDDNGLELLRTLKARGEDGMSPVTSEIPVVVISGHATIEDAVAATRLGAFDFMEKPLDRNRVMVTARNALERRRMWREVHDLPRAIAKKRGLFEVADGGTIFLDEIGDMALPAQAKVLRVLQTGEFTRVGGEKSLRTECRVVAATNRDLEQMVKDGTFREDLYFRLNVVPIRSPDLKERTDDVPLLVESFVRECCDENGLGYKPVDEPVFDRLKQYDWPGNVRER